MTATATASIVSTSELHRTYGEGEAAVHALRGVSIGFPAGEFTAIMGPSGSGKSTLMHLLAGLDRPTCGSVVVDGMELANLDDRRLTSLRRDKLGFVFQAFNLIPVLTAVENVELPLLLSPLSSAKRREHAMYALKLVGLEDRAKHRPQQLSGGQEQRVAIARAIATDPKLILADEPTGDLDRKSAEQVLDLLVRLNSELKKTILMVTHDPHAAERAKTIVHLDKGQLGRIEHNQPALQRA